LPRADPPTRPSGPHRRRTRPVPARHRRRHTRAARASCPPLPSRPSPAAPTARGPTRSFSADQTFAADFYAAPDVPRALAALSWRPSCRSAAAAVWPRELAVRWRTPDFADHSRQRTFVCPLTTRAELRRLALHLWEETEARRLPSQHGSRRLQQRHDRHTPVCTRHGAETTVSSLNTACQATPKRCSRTVLSRDSAKTKWHCIRGQWTSGCSKCRARGVASCRKVTVGPAPCGPLPGVATNGCGSRGLVAALDTRCYLLRQWTARGDRLPTATRRLGQRIACRVPTGGGAAGAPAWFPAAGRRGTTAVSTCLVSSARRRVCVSTRRWSPAGRT
jgi:hypothetical protein